jgi:hypothetical protein
MGAGMTLLTGSLLLFATLDETSSFWNLLPGLLVGGLGMATTMAPTPRPRWARCPSTRQGWARQ